MIVDASIIRPFCFEKLQGVAAYSEDRLLVLDGEKGYLAALDGNGGFTLLNIGRIDDFRNATGLDYYDREIWYTKNKRILKISDALDSEPEVFAVLKPRLSSVVVTKTEVYVATRTNQIQIFENRRSLENPKPIRVYDTPGTGIDDITFHNRNLWLCDRAEQTIYCLDPDTGEIQYSFLVPFESPTGIAFSGDQLFVAYCNEEAVIRDDGAGETLDLVMEEQPRNFIARLPFQNHVDKHYTLSGGYRIEVSYVEEIDPREDARDMEDSFQWWIGLPNVSERQEIESIQPLGKEFTIREKGEQKYAVFSFNRLLLEERHIFGWKAILKVRGIKYHLTPADVNPDLELPEDIRRHYLQDDDDLAMNTAIVRRAAREAVRGAKGILDKVFKIRNYVYEQLSYVMEGGTDPPDIVLRRGNGSCGEYLGVLMALLRLNGIACRKAGRYKVPYYKVNPEMINVPIEPDFNHVWLEFYIPEIGWIPMESSADDDANGNWTTRYFMGLQWYHVQMQRGRSFEFITPEDHSVGALSINHVRFRILERLE
jgi:transglutaminase-like putative cysteine protease